MTVHFLESVFQHGSIAFFKDIAPNMDFMIGVHTEDVRVKGCVMNPTEGESVRDLGQPALLPIGNNVRRVQELPMAERADAAAALVSSHNELAESSLVEANFDSSHCVRALNLKLGRGGFRDGP